MAVSTKNPVAGGALRWKSARAAAVIAMLLAGAAWGQPPSKVSPRTLTKVSQIRALSAAEAGRKVPIRLEGVITYAAPDFRVTFFQDETAGIYLFGEFDSQVAAGSLV